MVTRNRKYDVVGIGNALLDLTFNVPDSFLAELGYTKGSMNLIDEATCARILEKTKHLKHKSSPGGSSSNTTVGAAKLGGNSLFIGKVGKDKASKEYLSGLKKHGVTPHLARAKSPTGCAIALITPDKERTFATFLGAATKLSAKEIHEKDIASAKILHLEGYVLEEPSLREASLTAVKFAKKHKTMISIDLGDAGLIKRNLEFLHQLVNKADIVFANEAEAFAFTGKKEEKALDILARHCTIAIVKLGERGSLIKSGHKNLKFPINKVKLVNTSGAGDAYAAGILFSISQGIPLEEAGLIAAYVSAQAVACEEAIVQRSLKSEVKKLVKR